jgi:hypothetical protein
VTVRVAKLMRPFWSVLEDIKLLTHRGGSQQPSVFLPVGTNVPLHAGNW